MLLWIYSKDIDEVMSNVKQILFDVEILKPEIDNKNILWIIKQRNNFKWNK